MVSHRPAKTATGKTGLGSIPKFSANTSSGVRRIRLAVSACKAECPLDGTHQCQTDGNWFTYRS